MPQTIPTATGLDFPNYTQRTVLDGAAFVLEFAFNQREGMWYLNLSDADGVEIRSGIKLVVDFPLLRKIIDTRRPPGELVAVDLQNLGTEPTIGELGERVELVYTPVAELP